MSDWLGYVLAVYGPLRLTCNPDTRFGAWCLRHAGAWAYREETNCSGNGEGK